MKNSILEDFYLGNLIPGEKSFKRDSEYGRAAAAMDYAAESLRGELAGAALELMDNFMEAQMHIDAIAARENYIDGFKTGARFMLAILSDDDHGDLLPIGEKD